jgi:polyisoprenoid-binding protein YceI
MAPLTGTYALGPENATLTVRTGKTGAAAKAGHNLEIEVTAWSATLDLGDEPSASLTVDARSLRVRDGHGGMQSLDDGDKANIDKTIDDEVLEGSAIAFRSSSVQVDGDRVTVAGELELAGRRGPLTFDLAVAGDGILTGSAVVKQSDWGMKPYSTLFGTLKVVDEVEVELALRTANPKGADHG